MRAAGPRSGRKFDGAYNERMADMEKVEAELVNLNDNRCERQAMRQTLGETSAFRRCRHTRKTVGLEYMEEQMMDAVGHRRHSCHNCPW